MEPVEKRHLSVLTLVRLLECVRVCACGCAASERAAVRRFVEAERKVPMSSISAAYSCGEVRGKLLGSRKHCHGPWQRPRAALLVAVTGAAPAVDAPAPLLFLLLAMAPREASGAA